MKRSTIPMLLIFILLLVGCVLLIFRLEGNDRSEEPAATAVPVVTATPAPTATPEPEITSAPTAEPTAGPTATPAPTAVPETTPIPTGIPTAEPTAAVQQGTSGSFRSDTGLWINTVVKWEITPGNGTDKLKLEVYAESYAIQNGVGAQRVQDIVFNVDGKLYYANSAVLDDLTTTSLRERYLGSAEVDVPAGRDIDLLVTWYFRGEYGGPNGRQFVDGIDASATIHTP